ncbi:PilZ domain-containing protein [Gilvimarinus sp. DA14]|uniref:PilZ domain-containing protein n=1 Tax=Gilvimarinus sp. DA14 TaxID=2956798 RepID=UPI0020B888EE|nr:PilZ domain-containing protein [Gilvimarinus sp. DA14]UTF61738.1 PilZ domain-containing protein [Gilvimarinus sp. DA14]
MSGHERRRFTRIPFDLDTQLSQGGNQWRAELRDISLNGALVAGLDAAQLDSASPIQLAVTLSDQAVITMQTTLAHHSDSELGLACQSMDLNSMQHLRRMLELNLGDPSAAERELRELLTAE